MKKVASQVGSACSAALCGLALPSLVALLGGSQERVVAQIVPDRTLPVRSTVTPSGSTSTIGGGTRSGGNLFHSFEQFSVPAGTEAFFNSAPDIENIFTRVTGGSVSQIDGALRASGTANLFLLNPSGIIFGPNASLNIGGSFLASTASSVKFAGGAEFSAVRGAGFPPLLAVSVPVGLQFGPNPGSILVRGPGQVPPSRQVRETPGALRAYEQSLLDSPAGLRVPTGRTLALVGGSVALEGGILKAPQGRIELGSAGGEGAVSLNLSPAAGSQALGYSGNQNFAPIQISGKSAVVASGERGGDIQVAGSRVALSGDSRIFANTLGAEKGGTVAIGAEQLSLSNGAQITAATLSQGAGGDLSVTVSQLVELTGTSADRQRATGLSVATGTGSTGAGGDLRIETSRLIVRDGALVSASTRGAGRAGSLRVAATESVELAGDDTGLLTVVAPGATGAGGNLTVETSRLIVRDGARISAGTSGPQSGGNLAIVAGESVELAGTSASGELPSGLFTTVFPTARGSGGNLTVETGRLIVRDGAGIFAGTVGAGRAGTLRVEARDIEVRGASEAGTPSVLTARSRNAGDAGDLRIFTQRLAVLDGAEVSVSGEGSGSAGNLEIEAAHVRLERQGSLRATAAQGERGNITLRSQDLVLRHNSQIATDATGTATGGNITLDTSVLAALENSDISANAEDARGGNIQISTQGIFGTEFREQQNPATSDITATSNIGLNGTVEIQTPDADPTSGLIVLPAELVDVSRLIASGCPADRGSSFASTGRGGLPPSPSEPLVGNAVWLDFGLPAVESPSSESRSQGRIPPPMPLSPSPPPLVEATGWATGPHGEVILTAQAPSATPHSPRLTPAGCGELQIKD